MKIKILILSSLSFLAACGGGGGGGNSVSIPTAPQQNTTVLRVFSDGSGIARTEVTKNDKVIVANVISPNIQNYKPAPGGILDTDGNLVSENNFTLIDKDHYGEYYAGTGEIDGQEVNVLVYLDNARQLEAGFIEGSGNSAGYVGGEKISGIPIGKHSYEGSNIFIARDGSYLDTGGRFSMNVDFDNKSASIIGSTEASSISGSTISVDVNEGSFKGDDLLLNVAGSEFKAIINGNFHGNGATGVTGIYTDSAANPTVAGVIAGTRQP